MDIQYLKPADFSLILDLTYIWVVEPVEVSLWRMLALDEGHWHAHLLTLQTHVVMSQLLIISVRPDLHTYMQKS